MDETDQSTPNVGDMYFKRLALPGGKGGAAHEAALRRAHELRKFEIENYWRRS